VHPQSTFTNKMLIVKFQICRMHCKDLLAFRIGNIGCEGDLC